MTLRRLRRFSALFLVAVFSLPAGSESHAQSPSPQCNQLLTQDACQKTLDLFAFMAPQLGSIMAGGSPILGQVAILGRSGTARFLPGVSVGIRVNVLEASVPLFERIPFSITGASNATAIEVKNRLVPGPALDAAIGVFSGIPLGTIDVLGVDLLASAFWLPDVAEPGITVATTGGSLRLGWGARLGLLEETIITPAVIASFLRRELPEVDIAASSTQGSNSVAVDVMGLRKRADSWRVVVSKSFVALQLSVGGGQDRYDARASVTSEVNGFTVGPISAVQEMTRTNLFLGSTIRLGPLRASAELGRVFGGDVVTFNRFEGRDPAAPRYYGAFGARLTL